MIILVHFFVCPETDPIPSPFNFTDDPELKMLDVPPTAAFLILVTGILLLVIVMLALVIKCITKLRKKKPPRSTYTEVGVDGSPHMHQRVNRVRLDTHSWNHTSMDDYSSLSNPAPPSYTDTIQADQETHHQISQQTTSFLNNTEQISNERSSSEESTTNIEE